MCSPNTLVEASAELPKNTTHEASVTRVFYCVYLPKGVSRRIHSGYFMRGDLNRTFISNRKVSNTSDSVTLKAHHVRVCGRGFGQRIFTGHRRDRTQGSAYRVTTNYSLCSSSVRAAVCPCTWAIDRLSPLECQQPSGGLANQNAASHLRQPELRVPPTPIRVLLASASTLPGLAVRTESGGDGLPKSYCLSATAFGQRCSQCFTVCGSSTQKGI